jgi:hypothetical protein
VADVFLRSVPSDVDADDVRLYPEGADAGGGGSPSLSASYTNEVLNLNLTTLGAEDAISYDAGGTQIRKTGGGSLITVQPWNYTSNSAVALDGTAGFGGTGYQVTTTDFTASNITNKANASYVQTNNHGFKVTFPADVGVRTARIYFVRAYNVGAVAAISLTLSDASASLSDISIDDGGGADTDSTLSISFSAASAGQSLVVDIRPTTSSTNFTGFRGAWVSTEAAGGTAVTDTLTTATYAFSGKNLSDALVRVDTFTTATYAVSGKNVTDVYARNDSLSTAAYVISLKNATDLLEKNDSFTTGTYVISGKDLIDSVARADSLSTAAYVISGKDLTDVITSGGVTYADTLLTASYAIGANNLTDILAKNDSLSTFAYTRTANSLSDLLAKNDSLSTASYTRTANTLSDLLAKNDNLSTASYVISAKDLTDVKTGAISYADDLTTTNYIISASTLNDVYSSTTINTGLQLVHGWIRDRSPTNEQVEAERIRLGIIELKKEVKQVKRLISEKKQTKEVTPQEVVGLQIHDVLLKERLLEAQRQFDALLLLINLAVFNDKRLEQERLAQQDELDKQAELLALYEIQQIQQAIQQEEDDIVFVMTMIAEM